MKQVLYYGDISSHATEQHTYPIENSCLVTDTTVEFPGFVLSYDDGEITNKLDLLFYNRVNEIGEVLSSLIYVSNILELDDISLKIYDVKKLYINTETERLMGVTEDLEDFTYFNCKWASTNFFTSSISPLSGTQHEELAVNGNPSVKLEIHGITFDGWYTQMSVGFRNTDSGGGVVLAKDIIGIHTFADLGPKLAIMLSNTVANKYADSNWSPITTVVENGTVNPNGSILSPGTSLANLLITTAVDNPYVKQDLFILPTYINLYDTAVVQYAEYPVYGNPFPILRDKHRIIHNFAENNKFLEAQYILQTTELSRMTTQN